MAATYPESLRRIIVLAVFATSALLVVLSTQRSSATAVGAQALSDEEDVAPRKDNAPPTSDWVVLDVPVGDAIIVQRGRNTARVRLLGVEVPQPGEPGAALSLTFLRNLLRGESVRLDNVRWLDRDASPPLATAHVYRQPDGLFANIEALRQGYARSDGARKHDAAEEFKKWERLARGVGKGIWAVPVPISSPEPATTGESAESPKAGGTAPSETTRLTDAEAAKFTVYITKSGKCYHLESCYHLRKSRIPIKLSAARERGLKPCAHCKPPQ